MDTVIDTIPTIAPITDEETLLHWQKIAVTHHWTNPNYAYELMKDVHTAVDPANRILYGKASFYAAQAANAFFNPLEAVRFADEGIACFADDKLWQAACVWQREKLVWTRPNITDTYAYLKQAHATFIRFEAEAWIVNSCLTLAVAALMSQDFKGSAAYLDYVVAYSENHNDLILRGQERIWRASWSRQKTDFDTAERCAKESYSLFRQAEAIVGMTRAHESLGILYQISEQFTQSEEHYHHALTGYTQLGLFQQAASAHNGTAILLTRTSNYEDAIDHLKKAEAHLLATDALPTLTDNYLQQGIVYGQLGQFSSALERLGQCEQSAIRCHLYEQISSRLKLHQAHLLGRMGYLQHAHVLLEQSETAALLRDEPINIAENQWYSARLQILFGQYVQAEARLQKAATIYQNRGAVQSLIPIAFLNAEIKIEQENLTEAIQIAEKAYEQAEKRGTQLDMAEAHYTLVKGRLAAAIEDTEQSHTLLDNVIETYEQKEMWVDVAASYLLKAQLHEADSRPALALESYRHAETVCAGRAPAVTMQAQLGEARLLAEMDDPLSALTRYEQAMHLFLMMRQRFSEQTLAATYAHHTDRWTAAAVQLAIDHDQLVTAQFLIDGNKGQTILHHLRKGNHSSDSLSIASINSIASEHPAQFSLDQFRTEANERLTAWIALDYMVAGKTVYCAVITAATLTIEQIPLTRSLRYTLSRLGNPKTMDEDDLKRLGDTLIPQYVIDQLTVTTTLLIAPHNQLHVVSWAGLLVGRTDETENDEKRPLVTHALPVIIPSLNALSAIWQRPHPQTQSNDTFDTQFNTGLALTIPHFEGRHADLPQVEREADGLAALGNIERLDTATWETIHTIAHSDRWHTFDFWHIATHILSDKRTGRQSMFALTTEDIWIDQLWALSPLPKLVTLSGCSGGHRFVMSGDEQMGFVLTCLAAGADSVIAAGYDVIDGDAADLLIDFHTFLREGDTPVVALALAQRKAYRTKSVLSGWAHFFCYGRP